jgi:hypothetical protein
MSETGVILVGCSRTKSTNAQPAGELFRGAGFQRARDYAIRSGKPWFVLSAKYGLLAPDDVIGPYDVYLPDQPASYREVWGQWVTANLAARVPLNGVVVEAHASEAYCAPLRGPLGRIGGTLLAPLAGLSQGERLAWPGYRTGAAHPRAAIHAPSLDILLDPREAKSPEEFLRAGSIQLNVAGLYSWWVDERGAQDLTRGLGHPVQAGLLYAGKAGGDRPGVRPSTATLWSRIAGNHLRGNVGSSTLRKSLSAVLAAGGEPVSETGLSAWMQEHLRVAVLPVPSELVASLEDEFVTRARPPLNLAGIRESPARSALSRLRGLMAKGQPADSSGALPAASPAEPARSVPALSEAFERRVRADVQAVVAAGYRPTVFQRMLADHGAVDTARRLLASAELSDGFRYLWEHGLLRLSIENAVLDPAFAGLFGEEERDVARRRLVGAGYSIPGL